MRDEPYFVSKISLGDRDYSEPLIALIGRQHEEMQKMFTQQMQHDMFCDPSKMCPHWEEDVDEFAKEVNSTGL